MKKLARSCTAKSEVSLRSQALLLSFNHSIAAAPWIWQVLVRMKRKGSGTGRKKGAVTTALWPELVRVFLGFIPLFIYLLTTC